MLFMAILCLILLGVILLIYFFNALYVIVTKKHKKNYQPNNYRIKIPFHIFEQDMVKTLEGECGASNKPLRNNDISYSDNIKKYKEITVEGTCPEKNIIKACKPKIVK